MDKRAAIIYIIQVVLEKSGIKYIAGAFNPDENKFFITADRIVGSDIENALKMIARSIMGDSTVDIVFNTA